MRRAFVTAALSCAAVMMMTGASRRALAADADAAPPVTPFIDSGNDLPDLDARARETRAEARAAQKARDEARGPARWYGWQLMAADLGATACLAGLKFSGCLLGYWGSGIAIHLAHDRPGLAGASIGLRTGLPALGVGIGLAIANCPERGDFDFCGLGEAAIGALIGAVVASAVDAAIAFERVGAEPPTARVARQPLLIEPRLAITRGGLGLGVGAAF